MGSLSVVYSFQKGLADRFLSSEKVEVGWGMLEGIGEVGLWKSIHIKRKLAKVQVE